MSIPPEDPVSGPNPLCTERMSPDARLAEPGRILAAGVVRLNAGKSSPLSPDDGDSSVDYTRKSSEEGLDMEFNSLDAQREVWEAYIASQKSEGWVATRDRYDDGGFSGGNLDRPGLKQLLGTRSSPARPRARFRSSRAATSNLRAMCSICSNSCGGGWFESFGGGPIQIGRATPGSAPASAPRRQPGSFGN